MPPTVIAAARENLSDREKQLAEHLARVDQDLRRARARAPDAGASERADARRDASERCAQREDVAARARRDAPPPARREARRSAARGAARDRHGHRRTEGEDDRAVASRRRDAAAARISTGETGAARADARAALDASWSRLEDRQRAPDAPAPVRGRAAGDRSSRGARVAVGGARPRGHGHRRSTASTPRSTCAASACAPRVRDLRVDRRRVAGRRAPPVECRSTSICSRARDRCPSSTSSAAPWTKRSARVEKFLDESTVTDQRVMRIIHGHGTGQLRRALAEFLKEHPLVAQLRPAPTEQGGGGATVVELKD